MNALLMPSLHTGAHAAAAVANLDSGIMLGSLERYPYMYGSAATTRPEERLKPVNACILSLWKRRPMDGINGARSVGDKGHKALMPFTVTDGL
jgi:hypothetical protein